MAPPLPKYVRCKIYLPLNNCFHTERIFITSSKSNLLFRSRIYNSPWLSMNCVIVIWYFMLQRPFHLICCICPNSTITQSTCVALPVWLPPPVMDYWSRVTFVWMFIFWSYLETWNQWYIRCMLFIFAIVLTSTSLNTVTTADITGI